MKLQKCQRACFVSFVLLPPGFRHTISVYIDNMLVPDAQLHQDNLSIPTTTWKTWVDVENHHFICFHQSIRRAFTILLTYIVMEKSDGKILFNEYDGTLVNWTWEQLGWVKRRWIVVPCTYIRICWLCKCNWEYCLIGCDFETCRLIMV